MAFKTRKVKNWVEKADLFANGKKQHNAGGGSLNGLIPNFLPDGKTIVFVKPNRNIEKVVENYTRHQNRYCGTARKGGKGSCRYDPVDFTTGGDL